MKKILLLNLLCFTSLLLFSQTQSSYISKISDTLFKKTFKSNIENSYKYWDSKEDSLYNLDIVSKLLEQKLFDSAENHVRKFYKITNNKVLYYHLMSYCKLIEKQYDSSFYFTNQTLLEDPLNISALNRKAYIYARSNRNKQAEEIYSQLINLDKNNPENYINKANAMIRMGEYENAIELLKSLSRNIELSSESKILVYTTLSNIYLDALYLDIECVKLVKQPYKNAKKYTEKCIELDSTLVYNYYLRTRADYFLETEVGYLAMIADYKKIASLDSSLKFTCNFAIANALLYLDKEVEAVQLLNETIDNADENYFNTQDINDLLLISIIREMKEMPLYNHEENRVYFQLLSGALTIKFSKRKISRILKELNNLPLSTLSTRFNIYFARNGGLKLHMKEYGNKLTWEELHTILRSLNIKNSFENVDLMWFYAKSIEYYKKKSKNRDTLVNTAYSEALKYLPENFHLKWDYAIYKINNEKADEALAFLREDIESNRNIDYLILAAIAQLKLEDKDSINYYIDKVLNNDTLSFRNRTSFLKDKVNFAYKIGDFEMLHDAIFELNQLDPLTPYYFSQEAFLRFLKKPDNAEIEKLLRRMEITDMPLNYEYCKTFKGALMLLSGQLAFAKKESNKILHDVANINYLKLRKRKNYLYQREIENINQLFTTLDLDKNQEVSILYLHLNRLIANTGYKYKYTCLREYYWENSQEPIWIQAYQKYWRYKIENNSALQDSLQVCLKKDPKNVVALTFSSFFYLKTGNYQKAIEASEKAELYSPFCANAIWYKAVALYNLGKIEEARIAINSYNKMCERYNILTKPKYIKTGKKMLKDLKKKQIAL